MYGTSYTIYLQQLRNSYLLYSLYKSIFLLQLFCRALTLTAFTQLCQHKHLGKPITTLQDAEHLQEHLRILSEWTKLWQMKTNVKKCAILRCTHSLSLMQHNYTLSGHEIAIKDRHVYLGVEIDNTLKWSSHIKTISNKSTKILNFIKRNLYNCPADTKRTAYLTLVRPLMDSLGSLL